MLPAEAELAEIKSSGLACSPVHTLQIRTQDCPRSWEAHYPSNNIALHVVFKAVLELQSLAR